jgi:putative tryptophan/tyrosine transport system substrate-binding protein
MTMSRRAFVAALAGAPFAVRAQQQKPLRIGILSSGTSEVRGHLEQALIRSLAEQGFAEGRNLTIERRYRGTASQAQMNEFASELGALNLDAVVTTCTPSTALAKSVITSTPIIMAAVSDPVGQGLIASLARPGGNVTGLSSQGEELLPKMMELFSRVLPKSSTIAVLGYARNPVHPRMWQRLNDSASVRALGVRLLQLEYAGTADLPNAFDRAVQAQANAIFVLGDDPLALNLQAAMVRLSATHRLPDFYWAREFVDAGGLMSYGENLRSGYVGAGAYVAKVAKGSRPADLPVQQPTKFELVLNRKRAKALGISIPQDLALLADVVLE